MEHNRWEPSGWKYARSTNPVRQVRKTFMEETVDTGVYSFIYSLCNFFLYKNNNFLR